MITKYKIPCEHCGKETAWDLDQNIHQVNERLLVLDHKIATLWKAIGQETEANKEILKEMKAHNKIFEGYDEFIADCEKCDFRKKGSLAQVLKITFCPNCKEKTSLKAVILPPDNEELLKQHPPTAWEK